MPWKRLDIIDQSPLARLRAPVGYDRRHPKNAHHQCHPPHPRRSKDLAASGDSLAPSSAIAGGLIGLIVGYPAGAYMACELLWRGSNLCGLVGVFVTGPIGLIVDIVDIVAGWWLAGRGP